MARQRIKFGAGFSETPVGQEAPGFYSGPPAPKGVYRWKLKRLEVGKTGPSSQNPGSPSLRYMVEMIGPAKLGGVKNKFLTMGVWGNLNITEQGAPYVNNFLNSLTDGSETSKARIQRAFWEKGVLLGDDKKSIFQIGNLVINSPNGEIELTASTKMGKDKEGQIRTEIARFLTPISDEADELTDAEADDQEEEPEDAEEADDEEDGVEDLDQDGEEAEADDELGEEDSAEGGDVESDTGDEEDESSDADPDGDDEEDIDEDAGDYHSDDDGADEPDDDEHDDQPVAQVKRGKTATKKSEAPF